MIYEYTYHIHYSCCQRGQLTAHGANILVEMFTQKLGAARAPRDALACSLLFERAPRLASRRYAAGCSARVHFGSLLLSALDRQTALVAAASSAEVVRGTAHDFLSVSVVCGSGSAGSL